MSVTLFEPGIKALFHGAQVQRFVEDAARDVEAQARVNASGPILGIRSGDLLGDLDYQMHFDAETIYATVGSDATHGSPSFAYPGYHDETGRPWLFSALQILEVRGWTVQRT